MASDGDTLVPTDVEARQLRANQVPEADQQSWLAGYREMKPIPSYALKACGCSSDSYVSGQLARLRARLGIGGILRSDLS